MGFNEFLQTLIGNKQPQKPSNVPDNIWKMVGSRDAEEERRLTGLTLDQQIKSLLEQAPQQTALDMIREEEGFFATPKPDSRGIMTLGSGFNLTQPHVARLIDPAIIQGRRPITEEENRSVLETLVHMAEQDARKVIPQFDKLDPARQRVLTSMSYQLGQGGLSSFEKMRKAIDEEDWEEAAEQIIDSEAYRQTPKRFQRNADMFRAGGE